LIFSEDYFLKSAKEAYSAYFRELNKMVEDGDFDVLAHMDIVKRYGTERYGPFSPLNHEVEIRKILRRLAVKGMALEVNTITLRRPVRETTPSSRIIQWFREEGGTQITIGSDAHSVENLGSGLSTALSHLRSAGFENLTSYELRRAHPIPLP
jgi:histidinol-phosphatase (PHP family)